MHVSRLSLSISSSSFCFSVHFCGFSITPPPPPSDSGNNGRRRRRRCPQRRLVKGRSAADRQSAPLEEMWLFPLFPRPPWRTPNVYSTVGIGYCDTGWNEYKCRDNLLFAKKFYSGPKIAIEIRNLSIEASRCDVRIGGGVNQQKADKSDEERGGGWCLATSDVHLDHSPLWGPKAHKFGQGV